MKTATKIWASVIGLATLMFQVPAVQAAVSGFFGSHPAVSSILGGVAALLALFHAPSQS